MSTEEARLEAIQFALRTAQEALGVLVAADGPVDAGAEPVFDVTGDDGRERVARRRGPDLITQAAVQRAAERVVKDSGSDWLPNVNASFDPTYVTPAGLFSPSETWRFTLSIDVRRSSTAARARSRGAARAHARAVEDRDVPSSRFRRGRKSGSRRRAVLLAQRALASARARGASRPPKS